MDSPNKLSPSCRISKHTYLGIYKKAVTIVKLQHVFSYVLKYYIIILVSFITLVTQRNIFNSAF